MAEIKYMNEVLKYNTEYAQNAFGFKTGNRAKKLGVYKCKTCGAEMTMWLDYGRLPICLVCQSPVEWEYLHSEIDDVSQAGRDSKS